MCSMPEHCIRWEESRISGELRDDGFVPPYRMRERFDLARDRFIDWERFLKIWSPGDSDNKWKYIQPLVDAFNALRRKFVEQGTEVVIDESMGKWKTLF